jgi:hypothetical protein
VQRHGYQDDVAEPGRVVDRSASQRLGQPALEGVEALRPGRFPIATS